MRNRIIVEISGSDILYTKMKEMIRQNPHHIKVLIDNTEQELRIGDLHLDFVKKQVIREGKKVNLTVCEFEILAYLASHCDECFSHKQIYESIWKKTFFRDTANITAHIGHIRKKLEPDPKNPIYIRTVRGAGYKFVSNIQNK